MRGLVLVAVVLAGTTGVAVARPGHDAGVPGAGLPGAGGTVRPDGAAQPHGMVDGAGGPGVATCAGGQGNGSRPHHHSGNRHRVDPLAGLTGGKHGGGRCVD